MTEQLFPLFTPFPSIARLSRDVVVTEKLDGTNAQIHITETGQVFAGSRSRWITPEVDNYGFARWVKDNEDTLRLLGPGSHFGEWWGAGIQRRYGLSEKRFSLFNAGRWSSEMNNNFNIDNRLATSTRCIEVPCCHVVPVLLRWTFDTTKIDATLASLATNGSVAAPGFMQPEGIVVYHTKSDTLYKKTLDKNDRHKSV